MGMEEPIKKKFKFDETKVQIELEILQGHLLRNCLCPITQDISKSVFAEFQDADILRSDIISDWGRDRILTLISTMQLTCDVALKQNSKQYVCSKIAGLCEILIHRDNNFVDYLIEFSNHRDRFICFSASRTLSSLFLIARSHINPRWLDKLVDNILYSSYTRSVSFSLDVIKRIIEWKDPDKHILNVSHSAAAAVVDSGPVSSVVGGCRRIPILESDADNSDHFDTMEVKCICIKSLERKWMPIVSRFRSLISSRSVVSYQSEIVTFLDLWQAIISVKANLSVVDTKAFYSNLNGFVPLLSVPDIPSPIWIHMWDLFNEVLCYGSTLALQEVLAEEPCSLATIIIRSIKDSHLLSTIPSRKGGSSSNHFRLNDDGNDDSGTNRNNRLLLQKVVLIVLKAVAITVKETRYDSSSDSSLGSEADDVNADMALIERSIREVLRLLDNCVKTLLPFHPETVLAHWIVQLYSDQDDALIESMVCCLDVTTGLCYNDTVVSDLSRMLNPTVSFVQFLHAVSFDFDVLLDFLVSNETCFLLYLLRFLKYISRNWEEFFLTCAREIDETMSVLIRLRIAIERLVSKDLFPYNINPVLRLLSKCEQLYDHL